MPPLQLAAPRVFVSSDYAWLAPKAARLCLYGDNAPGRTIKHARSQGVYSSIGPPISAFGRNQDIKRAGGAGETRVPQRRSPPLWAITSG
jgi:hypothetical protein